MPIPAVGLPVVALARTPQFPRLAAIAAAAAAGAYALWARPLTDILDEDMALAIANAACGVAVIVLGRLARGWLLVGAGMALWSVGLMLRSEVGGDVAANAAGCMSYAVGGLGVLETTWRSRGRRESADWLDAGIVALSFAALFITGFSVVLQLVNASYLDLAWSAGLLFPAVDATVLAALLYLARRRGGHDARVVLLAAGLTVFLVADTAWMVDSYSRDDMLWLYGGLWPAGSVMLVSAVFAQARQVNVASEDTTAALLRLPATCGFIAIAVAFAGVFIEPARGAGVVLALTALTLTGVRLWLVAHHTSRRLSARLQFSERRREAVQSSTHDGIWRFDPSDEMLLEVTTPLFNIVGISDGRAVPLNREAFRDYVHPSDVEALFADAGRASRNGTPLRREARLLHTATGEWRTCVITGQAVESADGVQLIGTVHDLTEERRAAEQRTALARDLHDSLAQDIAIGSMYAQSAALADSTGDRETVTAALGMITATMQDAEEHLRLTLRTLRGEEVAAANKGLRTAIQEAAETARRRAGAVPIEFVDDLPAGVRVAAEAAVATGAVVTESLNNAIKHARATRVQVTMRSHGHVIEVEVADNGRGFDLDEAERSGRLGLRGIRERAVAVGAGLQIMSEPGAGTKVLMLVPRLTVTPIRALAA